ncbi:MAG: hypothetical protein AB8H86_31345 [Polyangiales bacterium]
MKTSWLSALALITASCGATPISSSEATHVRPLPAPTVYYEVSVEVVSGSRTGDHYSGYVGFARSSEDSEVPIPESAFCFGDDIFYNLGGPARARFEEGELKSIEVTGGPTGAGFGVNIGFQRGQFVRPAEAFIGRGEDYFGYLNANSYVDGAGTVSYRLLSEAPSEVLCAGGPHPI